MNVFSIRNSPPEWSFFITMLVEPQDDQPKMLSQQRQMHHIL